MDFPEEPATLTRLREMAALVGTGLGFTADPFDRERYARLLAIVTDMLTGYIGKPVPEIALALENRTGYVTPKIDVRGAVFREDGVLLVRERSDGRWALPGGYADVNLSPSEAIEAEILQESGYSAIARKLCAVLDRRRHHAHHPQLLHCYKLFFLCSLEGGEAMPGSETSEVGFFTLDRLPELSTGRSTAAQIARLHEHHRDPGLPADFD